MVIDHGFVHQLMISKALEDFSVFYKASSVMRKSIIELGYNEVAVRAVCESYVKGLLDFDINRKWNGRIWIEQ